MFTLDQQAVAATRVQQLRAEARRDALGRRAGTRRRLARRTR